MNRGAHCPAYRLGRRHRNRRVEIPNVVPLLSFFPSCKFRVLRTAGISSGSLVLGRGTPSELSGRGGGGRSLPLRPDPTKWSACRGGPNHRYPYRVANVARAWSTARVRSDPTILDLQEAGSPLHLPPGAASERCRLRCSVWRSSHLWHMFKRKCGPFSSTSATPRCFGSSARAFNAAAAWPSSVGRTNSRCIYRAPAMRRTHGARSTCASTFGK